MKLEIKIIANQTTTTINEKLLIWSITKLFEIISISGKPEKNISIIEKNNSNPSRFIDIMLFEILHHSCLH